VLASFLVLAGSTADRVGRRRIFQVGLAAFGLGSLLCGLAPSIGGLIAPLRCRPSVTRCSTRCDVDIANTFPDPAERARAIGVFGSMSGLSLGLGPILGGALVDGFCWRSIVRGMSALTAGLCLLPVGVLIVVLSPLTGRLVGASGPRLPLVVSGAALALGGGASIWLGPATPLSAVLAIYLLFGIFQGTINPPITNAAVSGMPRSMAGVAISLASAGRQTGTTLGVAISQTIVGTMDSSDGLTLSQ